MLKKKEKKRKRNALHNSVILNRLNSKYVNIFCHLNVSLFHPIEDCLTTRCIIQWKTKGIWTMTNEIADSHLHTRQATHRTKMSQTTRKWMRKNQKWIEIVVVDWKREHNDSSTQRKAVAVLFLYSFGRAFKRNEYQSKIKSECIDCEYRYEPQPTAPNTSFYSRESAVDW